MPMNADDKPAFRPVGDLSTVDGMLAYLGVADADQKRQRTAIARALRQPSLRQFVAKLGPDLIARGLAG